MRAAVGWFEGALCARGVQRVCIPAKSSAYVDEYALAVQPRVLLKASQDSFHATLADAAVQALHTLATAKP